MSNKVLAIIILLSYITVGVVVAVANLDNLLFSLFLPIVIFLYALMLYGWVGGIVCTVLLTGIMYGIIRWILISVRPSGDKGT